MFKDISDYLKQHLTQYVRIEHVGSTSIPDMDAKPVIDIDIEIASEASFSIIKTDLERIGYTHVGDWGIQGRDVFKRRDNNFSILDKIDHHLYVCTSRNEEYERHLLFRDRLRSDKVLMEEYKAIKYEILNKVGSGNRAGYVVMKENNYKDFFTKVLKS